MINRLINGQGSAVDPRPEPRFRGSILAVAPTISLTFCYAASAQLELLEVGEYILDRSRIGLHGCGLLKTLFNPLKILRFGPSSLLKNGPEK